MNAPDYRQQEELEHQLDSMLTDAYAEGRKDERQAWERAREALEEALEFVERYEDVRDGSYGEPMPNDAMILAGQLREVLDTIRSPQ